MSRGFVKEDDQEEIPIVPPRAYLPQGVPNYVTPSGMDELMAEKQQLLDERSNLSSTIENERRIALNHINAKLQLLESRIASARIVNPADQPKNEIRFSAHVTLRTIGSEELQTIQIVGVDEADVHKGKISFVSPLSRLLINKKVGERITWQRGGKDTVFEVIQIQYK
jgi:transcription elongation factor GreB